MSALSSPALVGRQEELLVLEAALAGAAAGEPALVVIGADAGAGKTRLVDEAGRRARSAGARLLSGTCLDIGQGGLPFGPVIEALRRFAQETSEEELVALLGPAQAEVHRLLPDIVAGTAGSDADGTDQPATAGARARLFELLLGLLGRAGETAPTLVVIEDVHWIDTASRGLLTFLAHNLSRERVLIVVTHRTDGIGRRHPLHEYLAELERHPRVRRLRLPPLRVEETERQLAAILGADPPIDLVGRIQEQAEGNPFYAEELLSAWQAGERVMPRSLRETLSGRLAALEAPAGRLVAAAAVAGRSSDERLLATVAELPPQAFLEALREAVDREILVPDEARGYRFRHALLRQAALDELLPAERRSLHARVAAVLDEDRSL
ncbi:MAG TPA: AAA family ATPase, partial [Candidatus Limnocylindrales bacterium]|nr:AAA family ATPase [Candidatus Limnocylindrales bacterium]